MRGASERLHETWKSSELSADVEELLSNPGSTTMGPLLDRTRWIIELTNFHPVQKLEIQTLRQITLQSIEKRVKLHDVGQATGGELRVKLPFQTPHLLDMYFAYTHSWFPIVANHNILRTTYQYSAPSFQIERSTIGSGNHASLWPILSNTTSQISPSTEVNSTVLASFKDALQEAEEFYSIARSYKRIYRPGSPITDTRGARDSKEDETFLSCFIIDTLLSVRLARRTHMRFDIIQSIKLLEEDRLEEWSPWIDVFPIRKLHGGRNTSPRGPLRSLHRLIELARISNRLCDYDPPTPEAAVMTHESLLRNLKEW
ncbi:hypothetical protein GX48_01956 [Paracoccidioides brasiliensis]|nr:hypothetical protein GX48_01956 [Paracoccidioides brasiliensis]